MKIFKTLILVTGLLCSAQAMACSVDIKVVNRTGVTLTAVMVTGPHSRESGINYNMKTDHYFEYHAEGSFFMTSRHVKYALDNNAGLPHCKLNENVKNVSADFSGGDGSATFTIKKEKNGSMCTIPLIKTGG